MFTIASFGQTIASKLLSIYPRVLELDEKETLNFGQHPLSDLYEADLEDYKRFKTIFKNENPNDYADLKKVKKDITLEKSDRMRVAISQLIHNKYDLLSDKDRNTLFGAIYEIARPLTDDYNWGQNHAFDDIPRIINAMFSTGLVSSSQTKVVNFWKKEENLEIKSSLYSLEWRKDLERGEIGYINGIGTTLEQAKSDAYRLSENLASSHNIHGVHSASHGLHMDLYVTLQVQKDVSCEPIKLLLKRWNAFFLRNKEGNYLQMCMSQGTAMIGAALSHLPSHLRERICVLAFGPALIIPNIKNCQVLHFVKETDIVPMSVATNRERIYNNPSVIIVHDDTGHHPHDPHGPSYVLAAKPYVENYLKTNNILV